MDSLDYRELKLKELMTIATKIIDDDIHLLEGVRMIVSLRKDLGAINSNIFDVFIAVDSESDHFPLGVVRSQWNDQSLIEIDNEMKYYIDDVRAVVVKACMNIISLAYGKGVLGVCIKRKTTV